MCLARLAEPGLRQRDDGFHLAVPGEFDNRLPDSDDLAGLAQRRRDDAVGIGRKLRLGELVLRETLVRCAGNEIALVRLVGE